jgi:outer membrane lipoprotein carrier protein
LAADSGLDSTLRAVEERYNRAKSLQVAFNEQYASPGRPRRIEAGTLLLRKPGRMRWEYSEPKGKLFVGDGKYLWLYSPAQNRVERMKMDASEDLRAPLAFLLGKLNFRKDFRNLKGRVEGPWTRVTAEPATENLPYSAVEFVVDGGARIIRVKVTGYDRSTLDFTFDQERMNPALDAGLFHMAIPPGAEVVEAER